MNIRYMNSNLPYPQSTFPIHLIDLIDLIDLIHLIDLLDLTEQ